MQIAKKKFLCSPRAVGLFYIALAPCFGAIYYLCPFFWKEPLTFIQSVYFSVVTITTLGYGDIVPQTEFARMLTALEAGLGVVTIGGFFNEVARRSDEDKESRRKKFLKGHLLAQYQAWRYNLVKVCLRGEYGGYSTDSILEDELVHFKRFREYFTEDNNKRWHDVLNELQSNEKLLQDIFVVTDIFIQQINYTLGSIEAEDPQAFATLTRVAQKPYLLKNLHVYSGDPVKHWGQFVFDILGLFSVIKGYLDEDYIETAINRL